MKKILFSLFCFSIISCQSSITKIINKDKDQYYILQEKEYIVIKNPYSILREDSDIYSPIKNILRQGTLLKVIYSKQLNNSKGVSQWIYVENIRNQEEKGWINPQEGILANDIHNGIYWQKKLKEE